ncbi:hypothetical protein PHIN109289_14130 [Phaeobacter inhibens]|uniref:hypothetical protein n=1 Tax=Phaeobacter inhibens TaxID=221822 RepID=UPI0003FA6E34|nr:hypothetical protein [Phaeobacter inhibens]
MRSEKVQSIIKRTTRLDRDRNGNPRYFIPAACLPVEPGTRQARAIGLYKYRGDTYGLGFVVQSYDLIDTVERCLQTCADK